jgi:hypothetical protein
LPWFSIDSGRSCREDETRHENGPSTCRRSCQSSGPRPALRLENHSCSAIRTSPPPWRRATTNGFDLTAYGLTTMSIGARSPRIKSPVSFFENKQLFLKTMDLGSIMGGQIAERRTPVIVPDRVAKSGTLGCYYARPNSRPPRRASQMRSKAAKQFEASLRAIILTACLYMGFPTR